MNNEIIWMQFRIIKKSLIAMTAIIAVSFLILDKPKPFILALIFGSFISILNFRSMAITLEKAVKMNSGSATAYASIMYFVRMAIYAVVIYVSIKAPYLNVLGTIIGLVLIKIIIQFENFLSFYRKK